VILKNPRAVIVCMLANVFLGIGIKYFRLDASEETLLLENDPDFNYARQISSRYGGKDFLALIFTPNEDLFSDKVLSQLGRLRDDLKLVSSVESVMTILDVPLLESPPVPLKEIGSAIAPLTWFQKLSECSLLLTEATFMPILGAFSVFLNASVLTRATTSFDLFSYLYSPSLGLIS